MAYTEAAAARRRSTAGGTSTADRYRKAAAACRHKGGISNAARALLSDEVTPANEDTFGNVSAKFGQEDAPALAAAKAAAIAASRDSLAAGGDAAWRQDDEYNPETLIAVVKLKNALSTTGNDVLNTSAGKEGFGPVVGSFWWRSMEQPDAFPPEFWELFLQSNLTAALGENCRPICVGSTMRRTLAVGVVRQYRPKLEEVDLSERWCGVAVLGCAELMGLRTKAQHQLGH